MSKSNPDANSTAAPCCIRVLPKLLINKIAAGEVVERPASVVKELMENALDAGPSRIGITIEDGGKRLIRVSDDGCGMNPKELRLAVTPHATSKIINEEDLYTIATMGFRGEALASISSVAKLRIVSRPASSAEGHEVRVAGAEFESAQATGCAPGTIVEVRDLFFNVPARRKFLRAASTEVGHINEQVTRLALAHPGVGFTLTNNGRTTQDLPTGSNRLDRIAKFFGPELAADLLTVERDERGVHLEIHAARPVRSRATTQWQYTFVNGRYIRDRYVQHAIRESYRGLMEPNRHGVVFVFVMIDPSEVDVNVHPTKTEVRWADSNMIHSQVLSALRETFQRSNLVPALRTDRAKSPPDPAEQERIRHDMAALLKATPPIQPGQGDQDSRALPPGYDRSAFGTYGDTGAVGQAGSASGSSHDKSAYGGQNRIPADPLQAWRSLYGQPHSETSTRWPVSPSETPNHSSDGDISDHQPGEVSAAGEPVPGYRPRAVQMHNLYLVVETDDGIVIVDQHALHERVMYEQLRKRLATGSLESQRLLLPETLTVTPQQAALLESNQALLQRLGLEVSPFGTDAVAVQAFPALLKDTDVAGFMRDLLDRLAQQPKAPEPETVIHGILDMMACKAAVKAGDRLTQEEIDTLVAQRHLVDKATSCPHGRPTMLQLSKADLNRQFHRT